jgi:hypothetical protein
MRVVVDNHTMRYPRPTHFQIEIAAAVGIDISNDTRGVAAARLQDYLAPAFGEKRKVRSATPSQIDYARGLGFDVSSDTMSIAFARIAQHLSALNKRELRRLKLKSGDRVRQISNFEINGKRQSYSQEFVVSSIHSSGRVFFKGIGCRSGWPTQLEKLD